MIKDDIKEVQSELFAEGFYSGRIDGDFGKGSVRGVLKMLDELRMLRKLLGVDHMFNPRCIFRDKQLFSLQFASAVQYIAEDLGLPDTAGCNWLLACIAFETGQTFSPSIKNAAGSGATGLIQFMPNVARSLGTTPEALSRLTAEAQLYYVWKYFATWKNKLTTLEDCYMAILWPRAVGKPRDYILWEPGSVAYRQNAGLDINKDRTVTKEEAASKVVRLYRDECQRLGLVPYIG